MIKMVIEMDEDKILADKKLTLEQIYTALDRIFSKRGMEKKITERGIEYLGHENSTDFAYFGKIMLGLKEQAWFVNNAKTWLFCNSDESDNPNDFNEEDLLVHYGIKVA